MNGMPMGPGGQSGGRPQMGPGGMGGQSSGKACSFKAPFGNSTTVTTTATTYTVNSTSCPPYDSSAQSTGNTATAQAFSFTFSKKPTISATPTYIGVTGAKGATNATPLKGPIGLAVNGVAVYSNVDALK